MGLITALTPSDRLFRIRDTMDRYPKQPVPLDELLEGDESTLPTAAVAECTCPEFCERDHANE